MELAADQQIRSTRFGRYEALLRIGRGGMAEVFAGRVRGEAGFQKLVAVKRMLPHLADDEKFAAMFLDEARLAANISSPHVVSTLDLGRSEDGSLYLVMELIIGVTLSSLLRNAAKGAKQIPVGVAVEILAQAAQGLHDAHEARTPAGTPLGIVHRDVSPQNVLIGADGRARITDFGVARAMLRRTDTTTGELKGKLAYFSPEQVSDDHIDRRSDVFALGIVAWETLTGRRLFKAENPLALLDRITNMPIPSVTKFHADVPAEVDAVVQKALERDREKRFASTQDFSNALREAARQTLPLPDRSVMSAFVQEAAGDRLKRMEESIRVALDDTRASNPPGGAGSLSAFPDAGSGVTMRSDADTNRRTGGSRGSSHPTRAQNPASTTKWRPSESGRSRSTSSQSTSSQATRGATRPSRPGGVPAPPPSFDNDDGPTVGEAPRARDGATKDFLLPDAGAGLDAMDNEATSLQPPAPLPKEAFGATHTGSTASRRGEPARSPRYSLADDGEHEGATVQAAPIFSPDSDAPSAEATHVTDGVDGVPTLHEAPVHDEETMISGRGSLGLPPNPAQLASQSPFADPFGTAPSSGGAGAGAAAPLGFPPVPAGFPSRGQFDAPPAPVPMAASGPGAGKTLVRIGIVFAIALLVLGTMGVLLVRVIFAPEPTAPPVQSAPSGADDELAKVQRQLEEIRHQAELDAARREQELRAMQDKAEEQQKEADRLAKEKAAADAAAEAARKAAERAARGSRRSTRTTRPAQESTPTPVVRPAKKPASGITQDF